MCFEVIFMEHVNIALNEKIVVVLLNQKEL